MVRMITFWHFEMLLIDHDQDYRYNTKFGLRLAVYHELGTDLSKILVSKERIHIWYKPKQIKIDFTIGYMWYVNIINVHHMYGLVLDSILPKQKNPGIILEKNKKRAKG